MGWVVQRTTLVVDDNTVEVEQDGRITGILGDAVTGNNAGSDLVRFAGLEYSRANPRRMKGKA
jgi:hypothetical protein